MTVSGTEGTSNSADSSLSAKRSRVRLALPFVKTSHEPRPELSSPAGAGQSAPGPGHRDLAIAKDGSFVETTSETAALALAKWYGAQGGEEYAVQSREEGGRKVFRIRPRAPPPSPSPERPSHASTSPSHLHPTSPFARTSTQPPPPISSANPLIHLHAAAPTRGVRLSRSIPLLRRRGGDADSPSGLLRPFPSLRRSGSTPSLSAARGHPSSSQVGPGLDEGRLGAFSAGSQGDVLGRLLGWSSSPPPTSAAGSRRGPLAFGDRTQAGTAQLGGVFMDEAKEVLVQLASDTDLPADLLHELESTPSPPTPSPPVPDAAPGPTSSILRPIQQRNASQSSPFGSGVRLQSSRSITPHAHDHQAATTAQQHTMREVSSSDSIRTAKADDPKVASVTPAKRFEDPVIFDVFQGLDAGAGAVAGIEPRRLRTASPVRHDRLPSSSSVSSFLSELSRDAAHHITVTAAPGDDPRFVIWGLKDAPASSSGASPTPIVTERRGSLAQEIEFASPATSASGSPATTSSKRWSLKDRHSASSPASSVRDSVSSGGGGGSGVPAAQRVLMAATVERWVAELTSKIEADLLSGFFLTYRSFVRPLDLLRLLITRFSWAMATPSSPEDEAGRRIVRVRTFVVIRHWLLNHFADDFVPDRKLRTTLTDWLNAAGREERIRSSPKDQRLIKGLKKVVRRLKEMHVALGPGEAAEAARAILGLPVGGSKAPPLPRVSESKELGVPDLAPAALRSSREDEDVDLEIDGTTVPNPLASSPRARRRSVVGLPFLANEPPPSPFVSEFSTFRSPNANFPLPTSQSVIARSVTSALGTFGRFKRMLGNRTSNAAPSLGGCTNAEAFDEVEFEQSDTGDLLWIKSGLARYLEYYNIQQDGDVGGGERTLVEDRKSSRSGPSFDEINSTGNSEGGRIEGFASPDDEEGPGIFRLERPAGQSSLGLKPHHTMPLRDGRQSAESNTSPRQGRTIAPGAFGDSPAYDLLDHPSSNQFFLHRPLSGRVELDDVDLSDEDEDVVEVKKTLKRLPGAHNLRLVTTLKKLTRHSVDTVSSYGTPRRPSFGGPDRESILFVDEGDGPAANQLIPNFILEGIDSDDDEPGDVEAALRRLEGLVDDGKEKEKARRVERQMEKSTQLGQLKLSRTSAMFGAGDEDEDRGDAVGSVHRTCIAASSVSSKARSLSPDLPLPTIDEPRPKQPAPASTVAIAPLSTSSKTFGESKAQDGKQKTAPPPSRSILRRAGPARKPSLTKLFATASRPVSARPGIAPPTHRSFILLCRTEVLAQQFCLIERDMLRLLTWQELVSGTWRDRSLHGEVLDWEAYLKERRKYDLAARANGDQTHSDVQAVIARFNLTANWIVLTANPDERVALIAKFVRLAFKCYCQSNFQTLTQIIHGLQSPDVERLKKTWARVPTWEIRKFRGMMAFVSHLKNFKHLREVQTALISQYGALGQRAPAPFKGDTLRGEKATKAAPTPTGAIPFLGVFLRDLGLNAELPTFLDPTSTNAPAAVDPLGSLKVTADPAAFADLPPLPSNMPLRPLVNVHKFRVMANIVQHGVLAFQEFAEGYTYQAEPSLYFRCLKIRCLDSAQIHECSMRLPQP